jgi:prevent-host-death family protein
MRSVNVHEAKSQLSRLLERVEAGERIVIARAGQPVAVLIRYAEANQRRSLGLFAGEARMAPDFDAMPDDMAAAFEGDASLPPAGKRT